MSRARHPAMFDNRTRLIDIVAVFDTTGSMSGKIHGLVESLARIVASLGELQLDWPFACVPFGDLSVPGDRIVADLPFHGTVTPAQQQLRTLPRFSGGSNLGESSADAMLAALEREFRPNAVKVTVLLTDEPALGHESVLRLVDDRLEAVEAICFTIAPELEYFQRWANRHGGTWQPIGTSIDGAALARLFEDVMHSAVGIVDDVHKHHGGSVRRYLARAALPGPPAEARALTRAGERARRISRALPAVDVPPSRRLGPGSDR